MIIINLFIPVNGGFIARNVAKDSMIKVIMKSMKKSVAKCRLQDLICFVSCAQKEFAVPV